MTRKRRLEPDKTAAESSEPGPSKSANEDLDTDLKLAILASLLPDHDQEVLLDALILAEGSVEEAASSLTGARMTSDLVLKTDTHRIRTIGYQSSLSQYTPKTPVQSGASKVKLTRKGQTLHLYSPGDIAAHTPCSIIHNFLPTEDADALLKELLAEAPTFGKASFRIFENVVQSPHSACFYVESLEERRRQQTEYLYNGSYLTDVRQILPRMQSVSARVKDAVNSEIAKRIQSHYPNQQKLKYQYPGEWQPNAAFVNCYDGGAESVGYHTDQLTYLGPHAVIVPKDDDAGSEPAEAPPGLKKPRRNQADEQGQIAIHLPHNSLLVMHAEMQEEWKHSIAPAPAIDPHPIAGNKRINITYRHYREEFNPKYTPRCRCGIATVLRCVQKQKDNRGRYMWMCHAGASADQKDGCSFFQWADFDDNGYPPWAHKSGSEKGARLMRPSLNSTRS